MICEATEETPVPIVDTGARSSQGSWSEWKTGPRARSWDPALRIAVSWFTESFPAINSVTYGYLFGWFGAWLRLARRTGARSVNHSLSSKIDNICNDGDVMSSRRDHTLYGNREGTNKFRRHSAQRICPTSLRSATCENDAITDDFERRHSTPHLRQHSRLRHQYGHRPRLALFTPQGCDGSEGA